MPVAQSPAHYINSSKGYPSITEYFLLVGFLVLCTTVAALPVVQPHWYFLTISHFSLAEINNFDHNKLDWAMLKLTFFTTSHSSPAENNV
jgi:hypothetical protein